MRRGDAGMPSQPDAKPSEQPRGRNASRSTRTLVIVFVLAVIGVTIAGRLYYVNQEAAILAQKGAELSGIRDLKIDEIQNLRVDAVDDGTLKGSEPGLRTEVASWLARRNDPVLETQLRTWLGAISSSSLYTGAVVVSADGARWVSSSREETPSAHDIAEVRQVLASGEATLTDLYLSPTTGLPEWDVVAPIHDTSGRPVAGLILRRDPRRRLFPLIQNWPTPSPSSETLLIRKDGSNVVYLNDLRFQSGTALKKSISETNTQVLAVQALEGGPRTIRGIDYRGISVFGAVSPIAGTDWYIVSKINMSEALASLVDSQRTTYVVGILSVLLVGAGLVVAWRQRAAAYYKASLDEERERKLLSAQYEFLNRYANDAVLLVDATGRIVQANIRATILYGYSADELLKMSFNDLLDPDVAELRPLDLAAVPKKGAVLVEASQRTKKGAKLITESSVAAVSTVDTSAILIVTRDITDRKHMEAQLRETSAFLENLIDSANAPIVVWDPDLNIARFNRAAERLTGTTSDEVIGKKIEILFPEGSRDSSLERTRRAMSGESMETAEMPIRHVDGSVRTVLWNSANIYAEDSDRTLIAVIAQGQDITERKLIEARLMASEATFRSIVESSPTAMYLYRLDGQGDLILQSANPAADHMIGIDHEQLVGLRIEEAFPNLASTEIPEMYRSVARGELGPQAFEIPYEDERFSGYYSASVFVIADGGLIVDFVDITDRRKAELELLERTEDLTRSNVELERFAYIASHDLQEPLRMIASYTQLLQQRYTGKLDDDADEFIGYAVDGAHRLQKLINELLAYSRVGTTGAAFTSVDLGPVLEEVLRALESSIQESGAEVTHDPMPTAWCDPTQIGQVFQNLVSNAIKFRGDEPPTVHIGAVEVDHEWVFSVTDNGIGVEQEYFDRIFVIFQRLQPRSDYQGTGLGLAICKRIIERHGGRMWVESEPGKGSTFYFALKDRGSAE
jgi:PAS domain S-box-containing protein